MFCCSGCLLGKTSCSDGHSSVSGCYIEPAGIDDHTIRNELGAIAHSHASQRDGKSAQRDLYAVGDDGQT